MDSINRKRRKTYPRKNTQQIFPFWIICFELTIIGNSKQFTIKEKMEHNILKSLPPLFNQGLECYDVHNYSLIHIPIPSNIQLLSGDCMWLISLNRVSGQQLAKNCLKYQGFSKNKKASKIMRNILHVNLIHPVLGLCIFLDVTKICMNQIQST